MNLVIGAFTIGLILSLLSLGMLISFRMIRFTDISVDGTFTLGASVTAVMVMSGWSPWLAVCIATLAGAAAGLVTGVLATRFRIQEILAGILVMTALYSVNLRIMGRSNISLLDAGTISAPLEVALKGQGAGKPDFFLAGWTVSFGDMAVLLTSLICTVLLIVLLAWFLRTHFGTALRATGQNVQMVRAQGVHNDRMVLVALSVSNGLVAFAGSLMAQYQGFADVQMGIGMMVWGLASIIIGEALTGKSNLGVSLVGVVLGTILFRLLIAIALRWGLNPNDLKLVTALFVFLALVGPKGFRNFYSRLVKRGGHA